MDRAPLVASVMSSLNRTRQGLICQFYRHLSGAVWRGWRVAV